MGAKAPILPPNWSTKPMLDHTKPMTDAQILAAKAVKLRSLAALLSNVDKLRCIAASLAVVGADHDAHEMFKTADRIAAAGLKLAIPDLND